METRQKLGHAAAPDCLSSTKMLASETRAAHNSFAIAFKDAGTPCKPVAAVSPSLYLTHIYLKIPEKGGKTAQEWQNTASFLSAGVAVTSGKVGIVILEMIHERTFDVDLRNIDLRK